MGILKSHFKHKLIILAVLVYGNFAGAVDPDQVVATIDGEVISLSSVAEGKELEIYEAEKKLYDLKLSGLRKILINKLIKLDPKSSGMSESEYISRFIARPTPVSNTQINEFIAQRNIPKKRINANLKEQARRYIQSQQIAGQVDKWLDFQKAKNGVEVRIIQPQEPRFSVNIAGAPFRGAKNAKVTIVEFSDFECPYCVKVNETLYQLDKIYGDQIKIVYKQFPLKSIHSNAQVAAEASLCAKEQSMDSFWRLHDKMFANQSKLSISRIKNMARELKLNTAQFSLCINSKKHAKKVQADLDEGVALGVSSTPAFFINGRFIKGALPLEFFQAIIEEELKAN